MVWQKYGIGQDAQKIEMSENMSNYQFVESTKVIHMKKVAKPDKMDLYTKLYTLSTEMWKKRAKFYGNEKNRGFVRKVKNTNYDKKMRKKLDTFWRKENGNFIAAGQDL